MNVAGFAIGNRKADAFSATIVDRDLHGTRSCRSIKPRSHKPSLLPLIYKGRQLDCGYRCDFLINQELLLEVKAVEQLLPVHSAQVLSYMKLLGMRQGLLINFNVERLVDGVRSLVLPVPSNPSMP